MSHSPIEEEDARDSYEQGWGEILDLINNGGSWSGRERNCCLLNTGSGRFADVSAVTGLDFLDDGRSVAMVDWDQDGDLDIWMSARTAPRIRFVRNDASENLPGSADSAKFLSFRLRGVDCNRDAIGARVILKAADATILRTLRSQTGYLTQSSKEVHFGLGTADAVDSLEVVWPGGKTESFDVSELSLNRRYDLVQNAGKPSEWEPPARTVDLEPSRLATVEDSPARRVPLVDRLPCPPLLYKDFGDQQQSLPTSGPVLITLWATWCEPCLEEFAELTEHADQLNEAGLTLLALSVDGMGDDVTEKERAPEIEKAKALWAQQKYPFTPGVADSELLAKLDTLSSLLVSLRPQPDAIPSSFLLDRHGRLAVLYPGPVDVKQLLSDVERLDQPPEMLAFPFEGRQLVHPNQTGVLVGDIAKEFYLRKDVKSASRYASLAADLATRDSIPPDLTNELAAIFFDAGNQSVLEKDWALAAQQFEGCLRFTPGRADAHANLGYVFRLLKQPDSAWRHLQIAKQIAPDLIQVDLHLGAVLLDRGQTRDAAGLLQSIVDRKPKFAEAQHFLGIALARLGQKDAAIRCLKEADRLGHAETKPILQAVESGKTP